MIGLVFDGRSACVVDDLPRPTLRPGEARISMSCAGVCNTDLEIARGYMGFRGVLGHEFVGEVRECDDATWLGARVVGAINCGCGTCARCLRGQGNHCAARTVLGILGRDGALAEELVLPIANLTRVPDTVSDEAAVFTEPLAAACRILEQVEIRGDQEVAVLGAGKLGMLIAFVLAERAGRVTLFSRSHGQVPLPRNVEETPADETRSDAHAARYAVVVDATGSEGGLEIALRLVEPLGTVVLKTTCHAPHRLSLAPVVIDEISVIGSRCGPFAVALDLLSRGNIPTSSLVKARLPLRQADLALAVAGERGARKVLVHGVRSS